MSPVDARRAAAHSLENGFLKFEQPAQIKKEKAEICGSIAMQFLPVRSEFVFIVRDSEAG